MQKQEFEFLFTLDGNIIVQRFFTVRYYNPNVLKSMDLYYAITDVCDIMTDHMKMQNLKMMFQNEYYYEEPVEDEYRNLNYSVEIKLDNKVIIQRIFPAGWYHPLIRRFIDIRPKIWEILSILTETLSTEKIEVA